MNKLQKMIGDKYADSPWLDARDMRNVIVHDYGNVQVNQVYETVKNDLSALKQAFENIGKDFE